MARGRKRVVGVLGGMGPAATVRFFQQLVAKTPAKFDQDHFRILIDNNPTLPNRHEAIGEGDTAVGEALAEMAQGLERQGADFLVMPCNTAHAYADVIEAAVTVPLVNIVEVACDAAVMRKPTVVRVGLLAAEGCLRAGLYQHELERRGLEPLGLGHAELDRLMDAIYRIKRGERDRNLAQTLGELADGLAARGAGVVIAACTEVPLVLQDDSPFYPLVDSLDALAARTVAIALGERDVG